MRFKVKAGRKGLWLRGSSNRSEELLYSEAQCVKADHIDTLLPLSYRAQGKGYRFEYRSATARPLKETLGAALPPDRFDAMLSSFLKVAQACDAHGLSLQRVCFHEHLLFFDPACYALRFVYAPVRGGVDPMPSPLQAIMHLALHARLSDATSRAVALRVLDYAQRSAVFSWPDYEALLVEQGIIQRRTSPAVERTAFCAPQDRRHLYGYDFISRALADLP